MTRITNLGRKRTYLEAGFGNRDEEEQQQVEQHVDIHLEPEGETSPKKPRKRRKKKKAAEAEKDQSGTDVQHDHQSTTKKANLGGDRKSKKEKHTQVTASERRRLNRIAEKQASTTCLACRKKGHAVKDCPDIRTPLHGNDAGGPGRRAVGICYRCGSNRHNLSRCKKPPNSANPFPFASCFVCSGKGHLASSCPQNQGKGIYPHGGSCKICGQTSHLAKDCELRTQENTSKHPWMLGGVGDEGGADEDDFHILKRRRDLVQKEEAILEKMADRPVATLGKPKPKVVVFQ